MQQRCPLRDYNVGYESCLVWPSGSNDIIIKESRDLAKVADMDRASLFASEKRSWPLTMFGDRRVGNLWSYVSIGARIPYTGRLPQLNIMHIISLP